MVREERCRSADVAAVTPVFPFRCWCAWRFSQTCTAIAEASADLVCVGHTHWPIDRTVAGVRVINTGSVSNPVALDLRASYALIDATEAGYRVEHRRVAYDVEAVIQAVERSRHPSGGFIISHFRGERRPWWANGRNG
jgi:Calcineurin-like phosphoesterase superfamily domain